ncbi:MAG: hypothetical protein IJR59_05530 [Firmicutes bacterium]|nr:hypothetical protein [Bacillota bacterium]
MPVTTQNAADVLGNGVFAFDANTNGPIIYSYPYCDLIVKSANNTVLKMNGSTDISVSSSKLTIENTNIRSNGYYGLSGGNSGTLLIKNSYIEAQAPHLMPTAI